MNYQIELIDAFKKSQLYKVKNFYDQERSLEKIDYINKIALRFYGSYSYWCYIYAKEVIEGRWLDGEKTIKEQSNRYPVYAYYYAKDVIKGRWIEVEDNLKKSTSYGYLYAKDVIKGRWIDVEDYLLQYSHEYFACLYAIDVIKDRWVEAEELIKNSPTILPKELYKELILDNICD